MSDAALLTPTSRVSAAAATDQGRLRTANEDRHYVDVDRGVFLVVDGVGGHAAGEVAAAIAVEVIAQRLDRPIGTPAQRVREAIALANNEILRQAERSPAHAGMTCVLTLALLVEDRLVVGHVGDSRLYKLADGQLRKITHDHSPVGEREDAGELSEADAMKHPRRSEVFRDVGSAFHEPDDPDFIELVETTFDSETAILLCSDGLSDMISSASIQQAVLDNAGDPYHVVSALIEAANEAGGKDNITVVYAEGVDFAYANATPLPAIISPESSEPSTSILDTRAIWLIAGLLIGLLGGVALSAWIPFDTFFAAGPGRTLVVGGSATGRYSTIADAVDAARAGDVVRLEPGEYAESIQLKDGVHLIARVPGTVTLVGASGDKGWTSVNVPGRLGNRISGIRLLGRPNAPISVGLRLTGNDVLVDDVTIEGAVMLGIDIATEGSVVVRASHFSDVLGLPMRIGPRAQPDVRQNVFVRKGSLDSGAAVEAAGSSAPQMTANVFVGYQNPVQWPTGGSSVLRDNFFMRGLTHGR